MRTRFPIGSVFANSAWTGVCPNTATRVRRRVSPGVKKRPATMSTGVTSGYSEVDPKILIGFVCSDRW